MISEHEINFLKRGVLKRDITYEQIEVLNSLIEGCHVQWRDTKSCEWTTCCALLNSKDDVDVIRLVPDYQPPQDKLYEWAFYNTYGSMSVSPNIITQKEIIETVSRFSIKSYKLLREVTAPDIEVEL